jgi:amidase
VHHISDRIPLIKVKPGEQFVIETEDTYNGRIRPTQELPVADFVHEILSMNPVGGPVYVEGAEKGDVLVVEVHEIIPDITGVSLIVPGQGPLRDSARWPSCRGPYVRFFRHLPSSTGSSGTVIFNEKITWSLHPFIGTIAVAPEDPISAGSDTVTGQGPWGGNLDCRDVCKGARVLLPVFRRGALLFAGDVHASQGDGELTGEADETRAEVVLSCRLIKDREIPFARVDNETSIVQLNVDKPLEKAINQAFLWLIDWLVEEYGFTPRDAYVLLSIDPCVRINVYQMVDIGRLRYTVGVEFPKKHLPSEGHRNVV